MALSVGTRIGVYEIRGAIGVGGMGEVYRAHDTILRRDVAIKVLPAARADDADHLARFSREARLLATLNHPRIATIHGFEYADGVHALAMELVEGPTLADKLVGPGVRAGAGLPLPDVLQIGSQIAEALEAAHEKGVIHRDLKPANIKFGHDGNIKVLDFGVAKAFSTATADDLSPTITATEFESGRIIGTPAYMSPEQTRGHAIDKRTDIWAFGCVLYEMLTGRRVFAGQTSTDAIAAILERQPDWNALPAQTPVSIRHLLRRCLEKDPHRRLHDIADARIEIEDIRSGGQEAVPHAPARPSPRWLPWASVVALTLLVAAAAVVWGRPDLPAAPEARLDVITPPTRDPSLAISPDGLSIVFVGSSEGRSQLWLRRLDSATAQPLAGTDRASRPFWSPDSRSIGFFADAALKRLDVDSGSVRTLASGAAVPLGGTWNRDGTILYSGSPAGPLLRTSAEGASATAVTRPGPEHRGHILPQFLPDGRHFLFQVTGSSEAAGVYVGRLDVMDTRRLVDAGYSPAYAPSGHLLFIREGRLLAQAFDPDRLQLSGAPFPIGEHLNRGTVLSVSAAGPIVYRAGPKDSGARQLVWVDRSGRDADKVIYSDGAALGPSLSPDGGRVAVYRLVDGNMDLWTYQVRRRAWDRVTFDPGDDIYPLWSHDGTSIIFAGVRTGGGAEGRLDLYRTVLGSTRHSEELLLSTADGKFPMDLSPDGRFLLYNSGSAKGGVDIWALPLEGDRTPFEVVQTDFNEEQPQFSPDGRWIAYQSNKTGRYEIYVRPFRAPGGDSRVSTEGGTQVRWNPKGQELFYIGADDRLMAAPIRFSPDGASVDVGTPVGLFATQVGSTAALVYRQQYMVSPDGQSFIMNSVAGDDSASPIAVILNWRPGR